MTADLLFDSNTQCRGCNSTDGRTEQKQFSQYCFCSSSHPWMVWKTV